MYITNTSQTCDLRDEHTHIHNFVINFNENINFPNHEFKYNRKCCIVCHVSHMFESISIKSKIHVCKGNSYVFLYTEYRTFIKIFMKSFVSSVSFYCRHTKCVCFVVVVVKILTMIINFSFIWGIRSDWNLKCEPDVRQKWHKLFRGNYTNVLVFQKL